MTKITLEFNHEEQEQAIIAVNAYDAYCSITNLLYTMNEIRISPDLEQAKQKLEGILRGWINEN